MNNIVKYAFKSSVFDLTLVAIVKVVTIAPVVSYVEDISLKQIDDPYNIGLQRRGKLLSILPVIISLASLAFSATKGGMILNLILNDSGYERMHPTYNALLITSVVFSLIEFGLSCFCSRAMKNIKVRKKP